MKLLTLVILLFSVNLHADEFESALKRLPLINGYTKAPQRNCPTDRDPTSGHKIIQQKVDLCSIPNTNREWKLNCKRILQNFPNKDSLKYALKGLKMNATSFQSNSCYKLIPEKKKHQSMRTKNKTYLSKAIFSKKLEKGITNKCQMIINDIDDRISTHGGSLKCKMRSYLIDFCKNNSKPIKTYSYLGFGTCKRGRGLSNKTNQGTTLAGFFLTSGELFNFSKNDSSYKRIRRSMPRGIIPATALIGLESSNNRSALDYKYLHVGAYTSAGCPSIDPKYHNMVRKMAKNGPSIVVNYAREKMKDFKSCPKKNK